MRKEPLEGIKEDEIKHLGSSITDEYEGFEYFIVWKTNHGIMSYVARNGKIVAITGRAYYVPAEKIVSLTRRYIKYLNRLEMFKNT